MSNDSGNGDNMIKMGWFTQPKNTQNLKFVKGVSKSKIVIESADSKNSQNGLDSYTYLKAITRIFRVRYEFESFWGLVFY